MGQLEIEEDDPPEAYDIVLFPPEEESGLTDEDSEDENQDSSSHNPNHLGKGILTSQAELATVADEELPDLTEVKAIGSFTVILPISQFRFLYLTIFNLLLGQPCGRDCERAMG